MRTVFFDFSKDPVSSHKVFGGYEGEHNATTVSVLLPNRLIGGDINEYRFIFSTSLGENIMSPPVEMSDSIVQIKLWKQLVVEPLLKIEVAAYKVENGSTKFIGKTAPMSLIIIGEIDGNPTEASERGTLVISGMRINDDGHLIVTFKDGAKQDLGLVVGSDADAPIVKGSGVDSALQDTGGSGGENISADGKYSVAFNRKTHADGEASLAANYKTHANKWGAAFNNGASAIGESSFATGVNTVANGKSSFVGGTASKADGVNDVALGNQGKTNQNSISIPAQQSSSGGSSGSGGSSSPTTNTTTLSSINKLSSFAMGNVVYANGPGATSMGQFSIAVGDDSVAIGHRTIAGLSEKKVKISEDTYEWVEVSPESETTILETDEIRYGTSAFASGYMTHASGPASAAFNSKTKARHDSSSAFGLGTETTSGSQLVCGAYNDTNRINDMFVVGGGSPNSRYDLFRVPKVTDGNPRIEIGTESLSQNEVRRLKAIDTDLHLIYDYTIQSTDDILSGFTLSGLKRNSVNLYNTVVVVFSMRYGMKSSSYFPISIGYSHNATAYYDRDDSGNGMFGVRFNFGDVGTFVKATSELATNIISIQFYGKNA